MTEAPAYDFSFLEGAFAKVGVVERPVNIFDIAGFPRRETVASNVLAFFLDPNERHGLATMVVDSLLVLLDGAPAFGGDGRLEVAFRAANNLGSRGWTVTTEEPTRDGKRIDVFLSNEALDVAVVIENKMDAAVYNPFDSYVAHATSAHSVTLSVVLSPTRRSLAKLDDRSRAHISAALAYDDLFEPLTSALEEPPSGVDSRSVDLLRQFIENTSEKESRMDAAMENQTLQEFWQSIEGKEKEFTDFFRALERVNVVLKRRADRLYPEILQRLESLGPVEATWLVAGYDKEWGRREGLVAIVYLAFRLAGAPTVELMLGFLPHHPSYALTVKAYTKNAGQCIPGYDYVPLAGDYSDADADIVDRFVEVVQGLLRERQVDA